MSDLQGLFKRVEEADVLFTSHICSVHDRSIAGDTPLHIVSVWGDVDAIKCLIDNCADINAKGENLYTPLIYAASQGHLLAVKYLVECGSKYSVCDGGWSAKEMADLHSYNEISDFLYVNGF